MKNIVLLLLFSTFWQLQAQHHTLFQDLSVMGAFGGPIIETGAINDQIGVDVGGGGGMVLGHFFLGGYGLGTDYPTYRIEEGPFEGAYRINFKHAGFWMGYVHETSQIIHFFASTRMGWGKSRLRYEGNTRFTDNAFVLSPEIGIEINVTHFFRLSLTGGYRMVNGVNLLPGLSDQRLFQPGWDARLSLWRFWAMVDGVGRISYIWQKNMILFFKALHVVGFVSWFAGLFYLVRMFVYHVEASKKAQPERDILVRQFNVMQWRVYRIICNPAMMITWAAGGAMLAIETSYFFIGTPGWMTVKLILLVALLAYHLYCKKVIVLLEKGEEPMTATQFRLFNEFPTLILVAVSFIAVLGKLGRLNYLYLVLGMVGFVALLMLGVKAYKRYREKKEVGSSNK